MLSVPSPVLPPGLEHHTFKHSSTFYSTSKDPLTMASFTPVMEGHSWVVSRITSTDSLTPTMLWTPTPITLFPGPSFYSLEAPSLGAPDCNPVSPNLPPKPNMLHLLKQQRRPYGSDDSCMTSNRTSANQLPSLLITTVLIYLPKIL